MVFIGRKTLKSSRARTRRIDIFFEHTAHVFLLSCALFLGLAWLSYRPALQIASVAIDGVHSVDQSAVNELVAHPLAQRVLYRINRNNMFFYPSTQVFRELMALDPRVANVKLVFEGRHRLHVTLEEFTPALLYCVHGGTALVPTSASTTPDLLRECYFADARGYVFASAPTWSGYPFLTIIASSAETSPLRKFALEASEYAKLKAFFVVLEQTNIHPHTVTILSDGDFRISSEHPWDILWASGKDPEASANNLALVLHSLQQEPSKEADVRIIDLRFGNKIFYK